LCPTAGWLQPSDCPDSVAIPRYAKSRRDHLTRKLRLREEALWLETPNYPRARIRAEVRQLKSEIATLLDDLQGATSDSRAIAPSAA